jgi:hypothetical protein
MFKLPQSIVFAIIAFNLTAFAVLLQLDFLFIHSAIAKIVTWALTAWLWRVTWKRRKKFFVLF